MKHKLKPCPFCGEKEDITVRIKECEEHPGPFALTNDTLIDAWHVIVSSVYAYVECLPCDAQTGRCYEGDSLVLYNESCVHTATAKWNRRS